MFKQNRETPDPNNKKPAAAPAPQAKNSPIKKATSYDPGPAKNSSKTVIGTDVIIEGNVNGKENLIVDGVVKGNITAPGHHVTIGPKGRIEGEIHAHDAIIGGLHQGKVMAAGRVEVTQNADFYGEIKCKSISVQDGAYFKGIIELQRDPHHEKKPAGPKETSKRGSGNVAPVSTGDKTKQKSG